MSRVILVDDDEDFRQLTTAALVDRGHVVVAVGDAETALFELTQHAIDAAVVDVSLPGLDGVAFIREIRRRGDMPLISLSGGSDAIGEAAALDAGADAYVTKPVRFDELDLRIRTLVRRASKRSLGEIMTGRLRIQPDAGHVQVGDRVIHLDPVDMRLLVALASSPLVVHSRLQLRERVFGTEAWVATTALERHIRRLRAVLEPEPRQPRHIVAVRGTGYRFVP